ncbi:chemotaxis protein CheD [Candidatus Epulonipiscium viviparus]|uniref:chemotaxis protein CheD n=1 Tax=Candidatus Epulonipiscium viviparus TaxID=420336 RepID=UPI0027380E3E|nr:chemotaxis protein CheD [Candidatus Epulopiscium viviparus]
MSNNTLQVGIAELKVGKAPQKITTIGLGSCVGVTLYDPSSKIGGMVHIMLPNSKEIKNNDNAAKFADTGVPKLVQEVIKKGANKNHLVAKIAGGAQMFNLATGNNALRIGDRNIIAVKDVLRNLNIPIKANDTGQNYGRTIILDLETGGVLVRTIGKGEKQI